MSASATTRAAGGEQRLGEQGLSEQRLSKYTALLDGPTAAAFDELALLARGRIGRKVDKSAILRVLIAMAGQDPTLRERLFDQVEHGRS